MYYTMKEIVEPESEAVSYASLMSEHDDMLERIEEEDVGTYPEDDEDSFFDYQLDILAH